MRDLLCQQAPFLFTFLLDLQLNARCEKAHFTCVNPVSCEVMYSSVQCRCEEKELFGYSKQKQSRLLTPRWSDTQAAVRWAKLEEKPGPAQIEYLKTGMLISDQFSSQVMFCIIHKALLFFEE